MSASSRICLRAFGPCRLEYESICIDRQTGPEGEREPEIVSTQLPEQLYILHELLVRQCYAKRWMHGMFAET